MSQSLRDEILELERGVWRSLATGDVASDRAALADEFFGVYPTGFAGPDDHAGQLADGPTVEWFEISDTRMLHVADGHVMLSYRADYRRPDSATIESMYVSSLWSHQKRGWRNVFSQDTPVGDQVV
jgi:hypothetical protein